MGMFDEVLCEMPLPDCDETGGLVFQTKGIPEPCLRRYRITSQGRLVDSAGDDLEPDGYIVFYTSIRNNVNADADDRWLEYIAKFTDGQIQEIVKFDRMNTAGVHYGLASVRCLNSPSFLSEG